jgi:MerR family transcriptional regulator, light-induced transcriptional regulator
LAVYRNIISLSMTICLRAVGICVLFVDCMNEAQYPIQLVARLTGLSAHVIRIWEQRYRAVEPQRTASKRRLYSQRDIDRLNLLRHVTHAGHSIGQIAQLPTNKLGKLAAASSGFPAPATRALAPVPPTGSFLDECVAAIQSLDAHALDDALKRAATAHGAFGLLQRVVAPLAQTLGDLWRDGTFTAAHEHFASAALRVFLGNSAKPFGAMEHAPVLIVATPAGQVHELGALLVGAAAANLGWQVTYLGASLPAAEIAGAAQQRRARAVALSLVYPEDDPRLESELTWLRNSLPAEVPLLAGGRAMPAYRDALEKVGALPIENLAQLGSTLDDLRKPGRKAQR